MGSVTVIIKHHLDNICRDGGNYACMCRLVDEDCGISPFQYLQQDAVALVAGGEDNRILLALERGKCSLQLQVKV